MQIIICKWPVPPNYHLQEACPSWWSFARGRLLRMIIWKRPVCLLLLFAHVFCLLLFFVVCFFVLLSVFVVFAVVFVESGKADELDEPGESNEYGEIWWIRFKEIKLFRRRRRRRKIPGMGRFRMGPTKTLLFLPFFVRIQHVSIVELGK